MAVYLVQHGKNLPKEQDSEQALSPEGQAEVEAVARKAQKAGISVSKIEHSPKLRARQTAEIMERVLGLRGKCLEREGIKAMDDPQPVAQELENADNLILVGHLPFMAKLTAHMVCGHPDQSVVSFQNGGIVCLDKGESGGWSIQWTLFPSML